MRELERFCRTGVPWVLKERDAHVLQAKRFVLVKADNH
jgi:hypothetical protein